MAEQSEKGILLPIEDSERIGRHCRDGTKTGVTQNPWPVTAVRSSGDEEQRRRGRLRTMSWARMRCGVRPGCCWYWPWVAAPGVLFCSSSPDRLTSFSIFQLSPIIHIGPNL
jgi:hypothetical protein